MIVEEAAFIDLNVFTQVVAPLLGMEESVLLMISSPLDSFNFFTKLIDIRDRITGQPIFLVARMLLVCDRCRRLGRPHLCKHRMKFLPPWKSESRQDIMAEILRDHQATMARESLGETESTENAIVEKYIRERWLNEPRFYPAPMERADLVLIAIDPSGNDGSTCSEVAIVSIAMTWNQNVVSIKVRLC